MIKLWVSGRIFGGRLDEEIFSFEDLNLIRKDGSGSEFVTRLYERVPSSSGDMHVGLSLIHIWSSFLL